MSDIIERIFDVRGMQLAAKCWHDPSKPPLLALHGWLDNAGTYDLLAPLLPDFHIVALDFAGHGLSSHRPAHTRYHTLDHVDDVYAVVRQMGWESFTLMGHSMGAGVASIFAGTFPEMIARQVLIEGIGTFAGEPVDAPALLRRAVEQWDAFTDGTRVFTNFDAAVTARQTGVGNIGEEAARLLCARGVQAVEGGYTWTTDKRLRLHSTQRLDEEQVQAFVAAMTAPTLLIQAEQGLPFNADRYAERMSKHRNLSVVKLPGGHHLHVDGGAERVGEAVRRFLS
jgi:pimeloyl-ACP methyl ester carboxylesterase